MRRMLVAVIVLAAVAACKHGGDARPNTESTSQKPADARETVEIPVRATDRRRPRKFASRKELEWAAAWIRWQERFQSLYDTADSILSVPSRRERAIKAGSKDNRRLMDAVRGFRSCSADAVARGAPPSKRFEGVALETAAVCERVEKAAARLDAEGFGIGLPAEAILAGSHLQDAIGEIWESIPGLEFGVPLMDRAARRSRTQIRYTLVTSRLVADQVTITCYSAADWRRELRLGPKLPENVAGFVTAHTAGGSLSPTVCGWLDRLAYGGRRPVALLEKAHLAQALATLGHEAQHALGTRSERVAECSGMQRIDPLARALGASAAYARELAELFWSRIYPYAPSAYRSAQCRPGGRLDLHPKEAAWP